MAQGVVRPDANKAIETGGNLAKITIENQLQRQAAEIQLLNALAQQYNEINGSEPASGNRRGFEIR